MSLLLRSSWLEKNTIKKTNQKLDTWENQQKRQRTTTLHNRKSHVLRFNGQTNKEQQ